MNGRPGGPHLSVDPVPHPLYPVFGEGPAPKQLVHAVHGQEPLVLGPGAQTVRHGDSNCVRSHRLLAEHLLNK